MGTINLAFHITGPMWAWLVLCIAVGVHAIAYSAKVGTDLWLHWMRNRRS